MGNRTTPPDPPVADLAARIREALTYERSNYAAFEAFDALLARCEQAERAAADAVVRAESAEARVRELEEELRVIHETCAAWVRWDDDGMDTAARSRAKVILAFTSAALAASGGLGGPADAGTSERQGAASPDDGGRE